MSGSATASGERLLQVVGAARGALEARAGEVDDLNVFPVADGDTGTNMLLTTVAVEEAARATTGLPWPERCAALARAALMGARGNSGMILSQLVRGAAESLAREGGELGGGALARALRAASDAAYSAVRHPVEGTMLTVARRTAEGAEAALAEGRDELEGALEGGRRGVIETPELLDVLREAGVVDSGGLGLVILLEGLGAGLVGRDVAEAIDVGRPRAAVQAGHAPSRYRYCTSFLVDGAGIDLDALEASLLSLGDSLLVMGDAAQAKVHVHTDAPERAAEAARAWGEVTALRFDDMRRQEAERDARLRRGDATTASCGALALVEGDGMRELVEGLGAQALSPDAAPGEIAAALDGLGTPEAVVVVWSPEGLDAARAAAGDRPSARVVDAASLPAALACLVALEPDGTADANAAQMREVAADVRAAEVDGADADALRSGLQEALAGLLGEERALVTVLIGAGAGVAPAEVEAWVRETAGPDVEVEAHDGGQPRPALAIGVE